MSKEREKDREKERDTYIFLFVSNIPDNFSKLEIIASSITLVGLCTTTSQRPKTLVPRRVLLLSGSLVKLSWIDLWILSMASGLERRGWKWKGPSMAEKLDPPSLLPLFLISLGFSTPPMWCYNFGFWSTSWVTVVPPLIDTRKVWTVRTEKGKAIIVKKDIVEANKVNLKRCLKPLSFLLINQIFNGLLFHLLFLYSTSTIVGKAIYLVVVVDFLCSTFLLNSTKVMPSLHSWSCSFLLIDPIFNGLLFCFYL